MHGAVTAYHDETLCTVVECAGDLLGFIASRRGGVTPNRGLGREGTFHGVGARRRPSATGSGVYQQRNHQRGLESVGDVWMDDMT